MSTFRQRVRKYESELGKLSPEFLSRTERAQARTFTRAFVKLFGVSLPTARKYWARTQDVHPNFRSSLTRHLDYVANYGKDRPVRGKRDHR